MHDDHFAKDTADEDWLPEVASRGWVVLTKDRRIAYRTLERMAVARAGARLFVDSAEFSSDAIRAIGSGSVGSWRQPNVVRAPLCSTSWRS